MPTTGLRLFRLFGVTVYVHWLWLPVAVWTVATARAGRYASGWFHVIEYLALFGLVLAHEFGHAVACLGVGGRADRIVLWPLGGVAHVQPPPRPGAVLWTVAAGPLVNVGIAPLLWPFVGDPLPGDVGRLLQVLFFMNAGLLVFNLLPFYPLDGGQLLRTVLWMTVGRARALAASAALGGVGAAAGAVWAWHERNVWIGLTAAFLAVHCLAAWDHARRLGGRRSTWIAHRPERRRPAGVPGRRVRRSAA